MYLPLYIALLFIYILYIRILNRFLCIVLYSTVLWIKYTKSGDDDGWMGGVMYEYLGR